MKKFLTICSISLCVLSIFTTTASCFLVGLVGTITQIIGVCVGISGVLAGAVVAKIEKIEYKNNNKKIDFEICDYNEQKKSNKSKQQTAIEHKSNNKTHINEQTK